MRCPTCHARELVHATADDSITVDGRTFTATLPALACPDAACAEIVYDASTIARFEAAVARAVGAGGPSVAGVVRVNVAAE
ncbi:MAG: hypothetical protein ACHREM_29080 [Polyangiales bacterium]